MEQILVTLVIILKRGIRPIERALIIMTKTVLVITAKILVVLEHKKGSKDRYYRLH